MAGRGPAPKPPSQRRRTNKPTRGEWVTLPAEPYEGPKPKLPKLSDGPFLASTKTAWRAWWSSPMAHMWTEADWPNLVRTIVMLNRVTRALNTGEFFPGFASMQTELRYLMDQLGLTEKGRRDLRWQLPGDDQDAPDLAVVKEMPSRKADPRRRQA